MTVLPAILLLGSLFFHPQPVWAFPQKGESAPPFSIKSTSGQQITLSNYRGKVLLLEFFATWCSPCRGSMPHLNRLIRKFSSQGLQVLGLSLDDDMSIREYLISNKIDSPVALANDEIRSDYAIRSVPTVYLIDNKGVIVEKFTGFSNETAKRLEKILLNIFSP